ncbi:MAG: hypothetical protein JWL79_3082 [Frankiales bacterium]|nr:hypothetical protein [Frankiales bacterium]
MTHAAFDPEALDPEALERAVAASCLFGIDIAVEVLAIIGPDELRDPALTRIMTAAAALVDRGVPPDPIVIKDQLIRDGLPVDAVLLATLFAELPNPGSAGTYVRALLRQRWRWTAWKVGARLQQAAEAGSDEQLAQVVISGAEAIVDAHRRLERCAS